MPEPAPATAPATPTGPSRRPSAALGRPLLTGLAVAGVLATLVAAAALSRRPTLAALVLLLAVLVAVVVVPRERWLSLRFATLYAWAVLLLPLTAIMGAAAALPGFRSLFAFRVVLALVILLGLVVYVSERRAPRLGPRTMVLLFAAWFAWLGVSMLWAQTPSAGVRYLAILMAELIVVACVAAAGDSRRRLRALTLTLAIGYALAVLVGTAEAVLGRHLKSSVAAHGGKAHISTGFFYNPNDFATFIAICWPFLLLALVFGRRWWLRLGTLGFMGLGLYSLLHTGSRSSLLAIGLTTFVAGVYVIAVRWVRHGGLVLVAMIAALAVVAALALNTSSNAVLQRFQVKSLTQTGRSTQAAATTTSAGTRLALTRAGFEAVSATGYLGVGPGNAEKEVGKQPGAPATITSLHDWWLEVFVNGGLPAIVLYLLLYLGLLRASFRAATRSRDRFTQLLAAATGISLIGYVLGSVGPSTVVSFAPMWILFGLALAVARRVHFEVAMSEEIVGTPLGVAGAGGAGTGDADASVVGASDVGAIDAAGPDGTSGRVVA